MYEELVRTLRYYGTWESHSAEAADAIEDLSKRIDRAVELYNRGVEMSAMYEALVGITPEPPKEEEDNFCIDCFWYETAEMYCFRQGCHSYDNGSCELWEPKAELPKEEGHTKDGEKDGPYDLLYEEGGYNSNGV